VQIVIMRTVRGSRSPPLNRTRQQQQQQVLLFAAVTLGCVVLQTEGASVNVGSSSELLAALQQQQVDRIVLQKDVAMGAEFDQYEQSPLQIIRYGGQTQGVFAFHQRDSFVWCGIYTPIITGTLEITAGAPFMPAAVSVGSALP
jgi:hypothetical protein